MPTASENSTRDCDDCTAPSPLNSVDERSAMLRSEPWGRTRIVHWTPAAVDELTRRKMRAVRQPEPRRRLPFGQPWNLAMHFVTNINDKPGRPAHWTNVPIFVLDASGTAQECKQTTTPKRNREFWIAKFSSSGTGCRDLSTSCDDLGYAPITVWQCETTVESTFKRDSCRQNQGSLEFERARRDHFVAHGQPHYKRTSVNGVSGNQGSARPPASRRIARGASVPMGESFAGFHSSVTAGRDRR